jgi:hypothetical protein
MECSLPQLKQHSPDLQMVVPYNMENSSALLIVIFIAAPGTTFKGTWTLLIKSYVNCFNKYLRRELSTLKPNREEYEKSRMGPINEYNIEVLKLTKGPPLLAPTSPSGQIRTGIWDETAVTFIAAVN